jgi:hypothetical protein
MCIKSKFKNVANECVDCDLRTIVIATTVTSAILALIVLFPLGLLACYMRRRLRAARSVAPGQDHSSCCHRLGP